MPHGLVVALGEVLLAGIEDVDEHAHVVPALVVLEDSRLNDVYTSSVSIGAVRIVWFMLVLSLGGLIGGVAAAGVISVI